MRKILSLRTAAVILILVLILAFVVSGIGDNLSLENLKQSRQSLLLSFATNPLLTVLMFSILYITVTGLSIPGATILTLAGGAIFGLTYGTFITSIASTLGATVSFLGARYLFRDLVSKKFKDRMQSINLGMQKEGAFYLFTMRLVPAFPFFLVNLAMGLTNISVWRFFFVSQIGMLPGTLVYVHAGTELSKIDSLKGILSPSLILAFVLLGIIPLMLKKILSLHALFRHLRKHEKPKKFDYNLAVIGGGSAGLVSAYIAAAIKAKVVLIEKHQMGGDCLNTGCVPSKTLLRSAKIFNYLKRADEFGIEASAIKIHFPKIMERIQRVIGQIAPHDSIERYTKLGVECLQGEAKILSPYKVLVNGKTITTKNIVIATGARPKIPNLPGLDSVAYLTSENIWSLRELPKNLVVLGAGAIGCELAQAFARLGSAVTLVEMSNRVLAKEDRDVSKIVAQSLVKDGVKIYTSCAATRIQKNLHSGGMDSGGQLFCERTGGQAGPQNHDQKNLALEFTHILLALGRTPNTKGLGLENLSIETSDRGFILADAFLRTTNYPNIFTCGDVTGPYQFTHTAAHQAWYVAVNALFSPFKKFKVDYRVIPWCTFTDPEVARVGLSETEAREKGIDFQVSKYEIEDLDRAIAEGEAKGFVKVLTLAGSDKILGATIVGHHAGDIIGEFVTAMKFNLGLNKILSTIHIYPTLSEANKFAAGVWKKNNAPVWVLRILKRFHAWRRGDKPTERSA